MKTKTITYGPGGWCAEIYTDDDKGSGFGTNPKLGFWYGTYEECVAVNVETVKLHPMDFSERPDFFDLVCERRFD